MPTSIKAFTLPDRLTAYFTIYLNSRLSNEQNRKSYEHELAHIKNGDYYKKGDVELIEIFAHNYNNFRINQ